MNSMNRPAYLDFQPARSPNVLPLCVDVDNRQQEMNQKIVNRLLDIQPFLKDCTPNCNYEEARPKHQLLAKYLNQIQPLASQCDQLYKISHLPMNHLNFQ